MTLLLVLLGGAAGAVARWATDRAITRRRRGSWSWGTLTVNLAGSFALGVVLGGTAGRDADAWVALLGTGFCGAFTTFSTFAVETVRLTETSRGRAAAGYLAASVVLGVALVAVGWELGRAVAG